MSPPKSAELLKIAREELHPVLMRLGLRQDRSTKRAWVGRLGARRLVFRLQLSKWNYGDSPNGYEFTAELRLNQNEPVIWGRLFEMLTDQERDEHRRIQNLVIAKLPLDEAELNGLSPEWQADRLARVAPRLAPYPPGGDIWFRYLDRDDVRRWMLFIGRVLPGAVDRLVQGLSEGRMSEIEDRNEAG